MENKRSNCAKIYIPFSFLGKRLIYDIVGLFYKLFDLVVGYILIKIDTNPVFLFICQPGVMPEYRACNSPDSFGSHLIQQKSKYFDIYEAEPFTSYIKAKNVPTVLSGTFVKGIFHKHHSTKGNIPKLFNIHNIRMYDRL